MSRYYTPCSYNGDTKQQMWMSVVGDFHDAICKCWHPFAHLLDILFPEGHKDKDLTIRQIIERDLQCHSGGDGEEGHGLAEDIKEHTTKPEEGDTPEDDADLIDQLISAADMVEKQEKEGAR